MNERIKQLAEQAGFEITPWSNESVPCVHQEGPIDVELEKFAQSIVRECAGVAEVSMPINSHPDDRLTVKNNVLKHFGVEE